MKRHEGTIQDLKSMVSSAGFKVISCEKKGQGHQIRTEEDAIITWYPSTKKIMYQGNRDAAAKLEANLNSLTATTPAMTIQEFPMSSQTTQLTDNDNKKVFLVHGHDVNSREQLELVIHKLGLFPFVLLNSSGGGLTIIEALEKEIGPRPEAARFGIVLMTPDDIGHSVLDGPPKAKSRARQNVVLETGMLISALGRKNVAILVKGDIELPSDASGLIYLKYNLHVKEVVPRLAERLREVGFVISPSCITNASF